MSVAVAVTVVVPSTVAPSAGALIATTGPVVSGGAAVVKVQEASAASGVPSEAFAAVVTVAVYVVEYASAADGVSVAVLVGPS